VGRSEAAKTCVAFFDRKVRSAIGWVPRDIFLRSDNSPVLGFSMKLKRCPSPRAQSKYAICHTLQTAITLIGLLWWKLSVQELLYRLLASNVKTTSSTSFWWVNCCSSTYQEEILCGDVRVLGTHLLNIRAGVHKCLEHTLYSPTVYKPTFNQKVQELL
jgi:hypothetical protein